MKSRKRKLVYFLLLLLISTLAISLSLSHKTSNKQINKVNKVDLKDPVEEDNWQISAVFYDSTVDNGQTPLTEINWDASSLEYGQTQKRTITIQINYKNTNVARTYNPHELIIRMPQLLNNYTALYNYFDVKIQAGANNQYNNNFDWDYMSVKPSNQETVSSTNMWNYETIELLNANTIEKKANIEGSIQVVYELTSKSIYPPKFNNTTDVIFNNSFKVELFYMNPANEQIIIRYFNNEHYDNEIPLINGRYTYSNENVDAFVTKIDQNSSISYSQKINIYNESNERILYIEYPGNLKNFPIIVDSNYGEIELSYLYNSLKIYVIPTKKVESEQLSFNFKRTYSHKWTRSEYHMYNDVNSLFSLDNLPQNLDDYIWVELKHNTDISSSSSQYPNIYVQNSNSYILEEISDDILVFDKKMNPISKENNKYKYLLKDDTVVPGRYYSSIGGKKVILAFPKSIYNEENNNMEVTINAELWGKYDDSEEDEKLDTDQIIINLSDYSLPNIEDLYEIEKKDSTTRYQQDIINGIENTYSWSSGVSVNYNGKSNTIKIGDDIVFIKNGNGEFTRLEDDEYYFYSISINTFNNLIGDYIDLNLKYDCELWVRYKNTNEYILYDEFKYRSVTSVTFNDNERVVGFYFIIKDVTESIKNGYYSDSIVGQMRFLKTDIEDSGEIYNYNYLEVYNYNDQNELEYVNEVNENSYDSIISGDLIKEYDISTYGHYQMRDYGIGRWKKYEVPNLYHSLRLVKSKSTFTQDAQNELFSGKIYVQGMVSPQSDNKVKITDYYSDEINEENYITGFNMYDLLPEGMILKSTKEKIIESLAPSYYNGEYFRVFEKDTKRYLNVEQIKSIIANNSTINITENYNNTNRTKIEINIDLSNNPIVLVNKNNIGYTVYLSLKFNYDYDISYSSVLEMGKVFKNVAYVEYKDKTYYQRYYGYNSGETISGTTRDNGNIDSAHVDVNHNGLTTDELAYSYINIDVNSPISTNQDVQVSVQSNQSNYDTGIIPTNNNSEYYYKLRVRTGINDITNLVIYDSIEDYAKNTDLELVKAAGIRHYWQGEFLGIDTTYAESKGYTIKTYYSENIKPGNLSDYTSWQEYNDSVDKSQVKSLAFQYLDSEGNPAIIPTNSLTYVLIKMKSPNEELNTFAYNGCWTEWNAIDPLTNQPVDFITGINSNIVRVGLPNSVVSEEADYTIEKVWNDNNNQLNTRPNSIKVKVIPDNDLTRAMEVTINTENQDANDTNKWTKTITLDKYDENNNIVNYSYVEDDITANNYIYHASVDNNVVTNNLSQKFTITKNWIDNNNEYLTRPTNTTIKVYQNDTYLQDITITGDYLTNEWSKTIYLPAIDDSGNQYNYTFEEVAIDKYVSTYDINTNTNTFTNTLKEDKTINIKKIWHDNSNEYHTRPEELKVYLKQNNNIFKTITLSGTDNEWISEDIIIPIYDSNGVKYTYSIEEDNINEDYTIIEYDQSNYTISNTLKKNITLTITKNWKDGSNSYDTRPDSLKINLLQNDTNYQEITLTGDSDIWTYNIEVPKYDNNQVLYKYSIEEDLDNTEYKIEYNENLLEVTNTLDGTTSIEITKKWIDEDNKYNTRPDKIIVNLLRNNELYKEVEIKAEEEWKTTIDNLPIYDSNGYKYIYTIEENIQLERYTNTTYNQNTFTITNELTDIPTVNLYFTLKNGYTIPNNDEIHYDEDGLRRVMGLYNIDENYSHTIKMVNVETDEVYTGKISNSGILEFNNIPYGTYKAVEEDDDFFSFISMLNIDNVEGIDYKEDSNGATITIKPTGKNIKYGLNVINKIPYLIQKIEEETNENPNTKTGIRIILTALITVLIMLTYYYLLRHTKKYNM